MNRVTEQLTEARARWADRSPDTPDELQFTLPDWHDGAPEVLACWGRLPALREAGQVWWGHVLMANEQVWKPGGLDMPGALLFMAETESEAKEKYEMLNALIPLRVALQRLSANLGGVDLSKFDLDAPVPDIPVNDARVSAVESYIGIARREAESPNFSPRNAAQEPVGETGTPGPRPHRDMREQLIYGTPFFLVHLLPLAAISTGVNTADIVCCIALYAVRMFGVTGGYHRYFSHRTYHTSRWFQLVLALIAMSSSQRGVLWWAAHHRHHHKRRVYVGAS